MKNSQLTHDGLAWAGGSANQDVFVSLIKGEEDLGLNGVEELEGVELLKEGIF